MADQEFLVSYAVDVDENGASRIQSLLESNRSLANEVAEAFRAATAAIKEYQAAAIGASGTAPTEEPGIINRNLINQTSLRNESVLTSVLPDLVQSLKDFVDKSAEQERGESDNGSSEERGNLDTEGAEASFAALQQEAAKPISLTANASGVVSAARSALNQVRSMYSAPLTITANVDVQEGNGNGEGDGETPQMSSGGRFTRPTKVQVAEDGDTEYIIPVRKEAKALPPLRQMLGELSPSARSSLTGGDSSLAGGLLSSQGSAGNLTINQNVSAPVNINVNTSGDAREVGQSVYNVAERYLLRSLKGVFA